MQSAGYLASRQIVLDGERQFMDDLAGVRSDDTGTQDEALFVGDDLAEAPADVIGIAAADDV